MKGASLYFPIVAMSIKVFQNRKIIIAMDLVCTLPRRSLLELEGKGLPTMVPIPKYIITQLRQQEQKAWVITLTLPLTGYITGQLASKTSFVETEH